MEAFLDLSVWSGLLIVALGISIPGIIVVIFVRKLIASRLKKEHERVGRLLFRVTASLLALLISLSYANEKIGYNKVVDSLEEEAALIASVMLKLKMHRSAQAEVIRGQVIEYVDFTIADDWEDVVNNPYSSKMWANIFLINVWARNLPTETETQKILKPSIISDIDMITKTLQVRIYSTNFNIPYLIYILGLGLLFVWCFYSVYRVDAISLAFITLYNMFLGILLYFVVMLGNPMVGPTKIIPASFNTLKEMGLDKLPF